MINIQNTEILVNINTLGAELNSLFDKKYSLEYMWQAGEVWAKHAPILFPIVGTLKNNSYTYKGKFYTLSRHGFAREQEFQISKQEQNEVTLYIQDTEETQKNYPFAFQLTINYRLEGNALYIAHEILNRGDEEMFFSFGMHPAFNLCFDDSQGIEDINLLLDTDEDWILTAGLNADATHYNREKNLGRRYLHLSEHSFDEDALIFERLRARGLTMHNTQHKQQLHFSWSANMPILGLWSKPNAPFVCLEPWAGICDHQDTDGELIHKKAICQLNPGEAEIFSACIKIVS